MRTCVFCVFLFTQLSSLVVAGDRRSADLIKLDISAKKAVISAGEPLSLRVAFTVERQQGDESSKSISLFNPVFILLVEKLRDDETYEIPTSLPFLPIAIGGRNPNARAETVDFAPTESASTIDVLLLSYVAGHEPGRPGLELFASYLSSPGTFRLSVKHPVKDVLSNPVVVTVGEASTVDQQAAEQFYSREHIRFLLFPSEWKKWSQGMETAERIVDEFPTSPVTAYAQAALGIATLRKAMEARKEDPNRQPLVERSLDMLEKALNTLPEDCPLVQECMMAKADGKRLLGQEDEYIAICGQLVEKYPHSPFVPRATKALKQE